jgi:hypothetical protein
MIRRKNYYAWERKADVASVDKLSTHCIENRMNIKEDSFYLLVRQGTWELNYLAKE